MQFIAETMNIRVTTHITHVARPMAEAAPAAAAVSPPSAGENKKAPVPLHADPTANPSGVIKAVTSQSSLSYDSFVKVSDNDMGVTEASSDGVEAQKSPVSPTAEKSPHSPTAQDSLASPSRAKPATVAAPAAPAKTDFTALPWDSDDD